MHLLYLASSLCCLSLKLSWLLLWQKLAIQDTRGLNSPSSQCTLCIIRYGNNGIVKCNHIIKHIFVFSFSPNCYTCVVNGPGGGGEEYRYCSRLNLCKISYEWVNSIFPVTAATVSLAFFTVCSKNILLTRSIRI